MGHEDRQIYLPSHVLQDPLFDHSNKHDQKSARNHHHHHHGSGEFHRPAAVPLGETLPLNYNIRENQQNNWQRSKEEDRKQAFFLVSSGRTTSGTGVFLPATAFHPPPLKKPAYSPVLLPARVVQALNFNIDNNGINISPRPENDSKKKSDKVVTVINKVEDKTPIDSPEKLLPEEWTY